MCFNDSRNNEREIIVAARPVQPTIIRTAPTFPVQSRSRPVSTHEQAIVLRTVNSRGNSQRSSPRSSQRSYIVDQRRSSSCSPRGSDQQIVLANGVTTIEIPGQVTRISPRHSPIQRLPSQRREFDRDQEAKAVAAAMLRPTQGPVVPMHRRSASNVIVQRSTSQRVAFGPRISDSILTQRDGRTYAVGQVIAPGQRSRTEISPRASGAISSGFVEVQTATGRGSRRQSASQIILPNRNPRNSDIWRPSERYSLIDARGNRIEYYR